MTKKAKLDINAVAKFATPIVKKDGPCVAIRATVKRFPKARRVDLIEALASKVGINPATVRTQIQVAKSA